MRISERASSVDCRVVLLTSPGRSAVATLSVDGRDAMQLVGRCFTPHGPYDPCNLPLERIVVGRWRVRGGLCEETVVSCRSAGRVEVNCHGGIAASAAIQQSLVDQGASCVDAQAWLALEAAPSVVTEAWLALTKARTTRVAAILLDQYRGAVPCSLRQIVAESQDFRAAGDATAASRRLQRMLELSGLGLRLVSPWRIVITGPPNVGKSSLINAILGYERSIVFDEPGTTRDVLTASTALDGWPVELIDTAGLRATSDPVESEGVARARAQAAAADLVITVLDPAHRNSEWADLCLRAPSGFVVMNKRDLWDAADTWPPGWIGTCALTGEGVSELVGRIVQWMVPVTPEPGEPVPITAQQRDAVWAIAAALRDGDLSGAQRLVDGMAGGGGSRA